MLLLLLLFPRRIKLQRRRKPTGGGGVGGCRRRGGPLLPSFGLRPRHELRPRFRNRARVRGRDRRPWFALGVKYPDVPTPHPTEEKALCPPQRQMARVADKLGCGFRVDGAPTGSALKQLSGRRRGTTAATLPAPTLRLIYSANFPSPLLLLLLVLVLLGAVLGLGLRVQTGG